MRRDIEFRTEDGVIPSRLALPPDRAGPAPTVVMAHGYTRL
jgi:dienelactone hydrolase